MDSPEQYTAPIKERKSDKRNIAWIVTCLLLLVGVAVLGYLLVKSNNDAQVTKNKLEASQSRVTTLEESAVRKSDNRANNASQVESQTSDSDSDAIVKVALAHAMALVSNDGAKTTVNIDKIEGQFARAQVSGEVGGQACVFKKSNDIWVQLYCAQSSNPELEKAYGVPESIIAS